MEEMNVEAYLERIKYTGSREPTVATLGSLSLAHKIHVPYTSLDFFGGPHTDLDLKLFYKKIVTQKGGGICYELNALFMWLLKKLKFEVHCGQAALWLYDHFTIPYYHMLPFTKIDGDYYIADPGWLVVGPMKCTPMLPHVETHGVFRIRNIPDMADTWFYLERHKKTVLDAQGNVLKQGPGLKDAKGGYCDDECAKVDSDHWVFLNKFSIDPVNLGDFTNCCEIMQSDPENQLQKDIILHVFDTDSMAVTRTRDYAIKKCVDPNTDQILKQEAFRDDQHLREIARDVYKYEVQHMPNYFSTRQKDACE